VRLTTAAPFAPILAHLTHSSIGMLSPAALERYGEDIARNPVGTYQRADRPKNPFTDARVRQAFNYAVDNAAINEFILGGMGRPSDAPLAPGIFGYTATGGYEYNPEKARQLLAEAGYPNGFRVRFYSPSGRYLKDLEVAEAVQAQLAGVGIQAEIVTLEWATYLDVTNRPADENEVPMFLLGWGTVTGDADYGLYPLFHSSQWVPTGSTGRSTATRGWMSCWTWPAPRLTKRCGARLTGKPCRSSWRTHPGCSSTPKPRSRPSAPTWRASSSTRRSGSSPPARGSVNRARAGVGRSGG